MTEKNDSTEQHEQRRQNQQRLIDMQSGLAFQERTIQQLSDEVFLQSKRIDELEQTCRKLAERITAMSQSIPAADPVDEKPPHY